MAGLDGGWRKATGGTTPPDLHPWPPQERAGTGPRVSGTLEYELGC